MTRKQRTIFLLVVFWAAVFGATGVWLWPKDRQEQLNRQLIAAIKQDDTAAALSALKHGADGNARDEPDVPAWLRIWYLFGRQKPATIAARSALMLSCERAYEKDRKLRLEKPQDNSDLVKALLEHGARIDYPWEGEGGDTPLWWAIFGRKTRSTQVLIDSLPPLSPLAANQLLFMAVFYQSEPCITEMILKRGADPDHVGVDGESLFGRAILNGDAATVRCLLKHRADPNRPIDPRNGFAMRPLEYAEENHLTEIAKLLRAAGARR